MVFGGKWIGGLAVNGARRNNPLSCIEIIYCPRVLVSTVRGHFDYVFVGYC